MAESSFSSNADEIRYYLKKLFADGMEHNRREISNYIRKTPDGPTFTEGMITGALKGLVDAGHNNYENTRRGWYREKKADKPLEEDDITNNEEDIIADNIDPFISRVNNVLDETIAKLKNSCTFNLLELDEKDQKNQFIRVTKISQLIAYISDFKKDFN